jgi:predicted dehydrogenase
MKLERAFTRRNFISKSAVATAGTVITSSLAADPAEKAEVLKVGLVGCGGRGTGACRQALQADSGTRLVAMADMFSDRLDGSLERLLAIPAVSERISVPADKRFVGFDAFDQLLASGVDVVLLATPPHFRPVHIEKAINAGVHVFAEKPVAVDGPGIRSVLASCKLAKKKKLSVVSGLCLRHSYSFQELVRRLHDGAIGDLLSLQANDYRGSIWYKERQPDWTDMHYQMRNWYYYSWLSGDFNVEQHVHFLDVCSWAKGAYPIKAVGMGGRHVRTEKKYGNIFDHHSIVYEYADGAKLYSNTRQMKGCKSNMSAEIQGSAGRARFSERRNGVTIDAKGKDLWVYRGEGNDVYQTEHDELFASIRSGKPINNGEYMAKSTLLAIMGRMATYTGQEITWDMALNSKEVLGPEKHEWGPAPAVRIAMPGLTKFI